MTEFGACMYARICWSCVLALGVSIMMFSHACVCVCTWLCFTLVVSCPYWLKSRKTGLAFPPPPAQIKAGGGFADLKTNGSSKHVTHETREVHKQNRPTSRGPDTGQRKERFVYILSSPFNNEQRCCGRSPFGDQGLP